MPWFMFRCMRSEYVILKWKQKLSLVSVWLCEWVSECVALTDLKLSADSGYLQWGNKIRRAMIHFDFGLSHTKHTDTAHAHTCTHTTDTESVDWENVRKHVQWKNMSPEYSVRLTTANCFSHNLGTSQFHIAWMCVAMKNSISFEWNCSNCSPFLFRFYFFRLGRLATTTALRLD